MSGIFMEERGSTQQPMAPNAAIGMNQSTPGKESGSRRPVLPRPSARAFPAGEEPLRPSHRLLGVFDRYLRWRIPRSFRALRLARAERFEALAPSVRAGSHTLIVCLNHPSWWDPLIAIVLSRVLLPGGHHYAPMEASALRHYGFMRRLGLFPVDNTSPRAGAQFLRAAQAILSRPLSALWVTPEGHFTDVRRRPICWKPGIGALATRLQRCAVLPLALEYPFWDERKPEALALLGEPLWIEDGSQQSSASWLALLTQSMEAAQDELAALAVARDPGAFATLIEGAAGAGGVYGFWKRMQRLNPSRETAPGQGPRP
jgi:1-acyl-sn-glycerol-3-phosphate acyltransferase